MSRLGPILIIDDDTDDQSALKEVLTNLKVPNTIICFDRCMDALQYLEVTNDKPFIVLSDINLPEMSGADLKRRINASARLRRKSIPFVFLTTTSSHDAVLDAYESLAQGFFTKPNTMAALQHMIEMILNYWKLSRHPNPALI